MHAFRSNLRTVLESRDCEPEVDDARMLENCIKYARAHGHTSGPRSVLAPDGHLRTTPTEQEKSSW